MAKRGRPKKDDTKDFQYRIRLSEDEQTLLNDISSKTGKTKADVFRESLRFYNKVVDFSDIQ